MGWRVRARIDLAALRHNLSHARKLAPRSKIMAVVKANAYGHGLRGCLDALADADALAVATLEEASQLRRAGYTGRVLLLEGVFDGLALQQAQALNLDLVVHQRYQLEMLEQQPSPLSLWLKVDTGMHRLGFPVQDLPDLMARIHTLPVRPAQVVLMSHLCCADQPGSALTRTQIRRFNALAAEWSGQCSLANSAGLLQWPDSHHQWVRPGAMLYGISPVAGRHADALGLQPVMCLEARVIAVNALAAGERVGYGARWHSERDTRIAIISAGYGDGYPRHAADGTQVVIEGRSYPLVGRVSMDMLAVDVGQAPVTVGMVAELWGGRVSVDTVAEQAGTIGYELVLRLTGRVDILHERGAHDRVLQPGEAAGT